jgi:copper chaperone CopZ
MAEKTVLHVQGMTCMDCEKTIDTFLRSKDVQQPEVDFMSGEVRFSPLEEGKKEEIIEGINRLGYHVSSDGKVTSSREPNPSWDMDFYFAASAWAHVSAITLAASTAGSMLFVTPGLPLRDYAFWKKCMGFNQAQTTQHGCTHSCRGNFFFCLQLCWLVSSWRGCTQIFVL